MDPAASVPGFLTKRVVLTISIVAFMSGGLCVYVASNTQLGIVGKEDVVQIRAAPTLEQWHPAASDGREAITLSAADGQRRVLDTDKFDVMFGIRNTAPGKYQGKVRADLPFIELTAEFSDASTEAVRRDGRKLVTSTFTTLQAGMGNTMYSIMYSVALAQRTNRLPVVLCDRGPYVNSIYHKLACVRFDFSEKFTLIGDGGPMPDKTYIDAIRPGGVLGATDVNVNGYSQYAPMLTTGFEAVCWALQPTDQMRDKAVSYLTSILAQVNATVTHKTRIVSVHVRRDDYLSSKDKQKFHGTLTSRYYDEGWALIRARVHMMDASLDDELIVVIYAGPTDVAWATENLRFEGAKHVIVAKPFSLTRGSGDEPVDMYAMSLGDFIITANSSYSWWAHFLNMCRRAFSNWVSLSGFLARELLPFEGIVLPYKLLNAQVGSRSDMMLLLVSDRYLFPSLDDLFDFVE